MLQPCHCSYPVCFCVGFLHFLGSRLGQTCSLRHSQAKGSKGMRHACSGENEICVGLLHRSTGQSWTSCNFQNRREYQDPRPCTKTQTPKSEKKGATFRKRSVWKFGSCYLNLVTLRNDQKDKPREWIPILSHLIQ